MSAPEEPSGPSAYDEFDEVLAEVMEILQETSSIEDIPSAGRALTPYHAAAAVLSTFDKDTIAPFTEADSNGFSEPGAKEVLLADSRLAGSGKNARWSLLLDVRRAALSRLGKISTIQRAIDANARQKPDQDPVQEMFERYLNGNAPELQEQTSQQVSGTRQVLEWLDGLGLVKSLPSSKEVRDRSDFLSLIEPLYTIAGEFFAGREKELAQLRDHVGVMPPGSVAAIFRRLASGMFKRDKPPLLLWGAGGRGKSTVISRFLWEHATLHAPDRFPWAFLDFDRPGLVAEEPLTLLIEALRQLGIQYPDARESCEILRQHWSRQLTERTNDFRRLLNESIAEKDSAYAAELSTREAQDTWLQHFAQLLSLFKDENDPFLIVLDTFERVQYRSEVAVSSLLEFLGLFQEKVPRLRVVIAGRSPLSPSLSLPRSEIPLEDFDEPAALVLLGKLGVTDESDARAVFSSVGGNALSLRLAAEVLKREGTFASLPSRRLFGFFIKDNTVQAQLFDRILNHIHDPVVRRLAFPGMLLRRITADIIQRVLAPVSGVDVPDAATAELLFREMSREVALVTRNGDALVHRMDVRCLVIGVLREDRPSVAQKVEEAMIAYYAARSDEQQLGPELFLIERAEEIYHRLSQQHPARAVADRWVDGVASYLESALDELAVAERAWLAARIGRPLTPKERALADLDGWERDSLRRARALLQRNEVEQALEVLGERTDRLPGSALYSVQAEILETLGRWEDLSELLQRGIISADSAGNRDLAVDLRIRAVRSSLRAGLLEVARLNLDEAFALSNDGLPIRAIEVGLHRLAWLRAVQCNGADAGNEAFRVDVVRRLRKTFDVLDDEAIRGQTTLVAWLAAEVAMGEPEVAQRAARLVGVSAISPARVRTLAREIAVIDSKHPRPGALADAAGAPSAPTLTQRWTELTLTLSPQSLGSVVADTMANVTFSPQATMALVELFRGMARSRLVPGDTLAIAEDRGSMEEQRFLAAAPSGITTRAVSSIHSRRSPKWSDLQELARALMDAFPSRQALADMLAYKLDIRLEVISLSGSLLTSIFDLVKFVAQQGQLAALITAARESVPGNTHLQELAASYGLATQVPTAQLEELTGQLSRFIDPDEFRQFLGVVDSQVCRVELRNSDPGDHRAGGTGFLIGPDLVLTAFHVVAPLLRNEVAAADARLRFDYLQSADVSVANSGTPHRLATDWLVTHSPLPDGEIRGAIQTEFLDYAILRLARPAGIEPRGGSRAEPNARPRLWITLSSNATVAPLDPVLVLQYPTDDALRLSVGRVVQLDIARGRILHDADTFAGSSGAPCFDFKWNLVGIQLGTTGPSRKLGFAASASLIVRDLQAKNVGGVLDQRLV